jgi:hypothetical protein
MMSRALIDLADWIDASAVTATDGVGAALPPAITAITSQPAPQQKASKQIKLPDTAKGSNQTALT